MLILAHAAWLVWRTVRGARAAEAAAAPATTTEARDADWYARAADRAAAEGRIAEALQLAFVALALGLDRQGCSITRARHPRSAPGTRAWPRRTGNGSAGWCARSTCTPSAAGRSPRTIMALARRRRGALACARGLSSASRPGSWPCWR